MAPVLQKGHGLFVSLVCWLAIPTRGQIPNPFGRDYNARVWRPSAPDFVYPELAPELNLTSRLDFGIGLAGGGTRGSSLGQGILRVLRKEGMLEQARYLSTSSGSVALGIHLYFQTMDSLDDYFGEVMSPEKLDPETVSSTRAAGTGTTRLTYFERYPQNSTPAQSTKAKQHKDIELDRFSKLVASFGFPDPFAWLMELMRCLKSGEEICSCLVQLSIPDTSWENAMELLFAYIVLYPFGLADPYSSYAHTTAMHRVRKSLGMVVKIYESQDAKHNLPFLIGQSAILAPYSGRPDQGGNLSAFPLEHTPLYVGTSPSYSGQDALPYTGIGDNLVDPFIFSGTPSGPMSSANVSEMEIKPTTSTINAGQLSSWLGIATAYIADFQIRGWADQLPQCLVAVGEKILPHATIWSPNDVQSNFTNVPYAHDAPVGDAGIYDDIGHLPLLRRKIKKMVLFDSSAVHDAENPQKKDREDLCEMTFLMAAFGQPGCRPFEKNAPGASNSKMLRDYMTVFEPSEFASFWSKVVANHKAGEPTVYRGTFTVLDNRHWGVVGGWKVEIVWIVALPSKSWRAALPINTSALIPEFFPNFAATEDNTHFMMGATTQYASWVAQKAMPEIRAMLADDVHKTSKEDTIVV